MKRRIRVRFHLGRGEHYRQWQVRWEDGRVVYYKPEDWVLVMHNCKLRNRRSVADRIHAGENKSVCAWIMCESVGLYPTAVYPRLHSTGSEVTYNPRVRPYWASPMGFDIDDTEHAGVYTFGRCVFVGQVAV